MNKDNFTEDTSIPKSTSPPPRLSSPDAGAGGPFSLTGRARSFRHAINGIILMLKSQHNAWLHATASIVILAVGAFFHLGAKDWCWLVIAIIAVWTAEALNTALEFLADVASPKYHPIVEKAKDVAAGAVLISATGSVVIGLLILGPYVLKFFSSA